MLQVMIGGDEKKRTKLCCDDEGVMWKGRRDLMKTEAATYSLATAVQSIS